MSDENIRKIHTLINDSLSKACKWEMILRNPASLVDPPKVAKKEVQVWDQDEIAAFLDTAKETRYYEAFLLALTTGMRQGEILGLRFKDIDEENQTIAIVQTLSHEGKILSVGAKTETGNRRISVDAETLSQVLRLKKRYKEEILANRPLYNDLDLVIRTNVGTPLSPRNLLRTYDSIIKKANVRKISIHDLRHTHASLLLKQGVNPKIVSERLGHATLGLHLTGIATSFLIYKRKQLKNSANYFIRLTNLRKVIRIKFVSNLTNTQKRPLIPKWSFSFKH